MPTFSMSDETPTPLPSTTDYRAIRIENLRKLELPDIDPIPAIAAIVLILFLSLLRMVIDFFEVIESVKIQEIHSCQHTRVILPFACHM